ncbi:MAG TPA: tRNA pseudouridine(38-40) synthase TruA [Thiobacillaceae bacterium]|nr:tRNA pseudouridine(38-40) synthase TruA [Thiobacillaceae bacterium]HNA81536.1 tRNA pseudouridine(38-40) synthase TruA [Thiobacillaceae bacterium]HNF88074.1 tRNA pseudouridine(38-40) synthase TruA [Thiobacillaceae bacterium]HNH88661.1 tRNA pseudouridine(38-40) synthase TruA [Thiobacillaceae bacterium]HNI08206.1 tRNA pseudouridine(38-40) synthase TruA [Thiobacillaceae bacterium]
MAGRVALGLEYDGRSFCGWQTQPGGCALQDHLELALARIHGTPLHTTVAGRTDAGVHAFAQVVHFDTREDRPEQAWVRGTNSHLPEGVSVLWARRVVDGFDARRAALERSYRYVLHTRPVRSALLAGRVGWVFGELNEGAMAMAAESLVGTHDFSAFRAAECQARSPIREMRAVSLRRQGEFLILDFRANAFLHHQIRNMVGALVWVGLGRRPPEWVAAVLASRDRSQGAATFAPDGLYLTGVRYDPNFGLPNPPTPFIPFQS